MSEADLIIEDDVHTRRQRLREERKRILKICIQKLQRIQDPESVLCRSVLINNTLRSIQEEHKENQKRVKLKRQKESFCDDFDTKRMRFEDQVRDNEDEGDADDEEEDNKTDDVKCDVATPICTLDEVILCDNTETSNDIHVWCDEELDEVGSEFKENAEKISKSSFEFSISALNYRHLSDRSSHTLALDNDALIGSTQLSEKEDCSAQFGDAFPNSIINNSSMSLKS